LFGKVNGQRLSPFDESKLTQVLIDGQPVKPQNWKEVTKGVIQIDLQSSALPDSTFVLTVDADFGEGKPGPICSDSVLIRRRN